MMRDLESCEWCPGSEPRSKMCPSFVQKPGLCRYCQDVATKQDVKKNRPVGAKTPLVSASVQSLIQEVKSVRSKLKASEADLAYIRRKLEHETVDIQADVKEGLAQVLSREDIHDPFLKLFWEEQKKASMRNPHGMRWHPLMIRFAIFLHFQSPQAYQALKSTGVLLLPNQATLRDYTNFYQPREGFSAHIFQDLRQKAEKLPEEKRFVALMHDEMSIRGDLVYDRRVGEIIGFVNPNTWNFKKDACSDLASHVLVFMIIGINNNIKTAVGYFATRSATADVLFPLLWEAVSHLEQQGLKVITCTSDKASPNQKLYGMHGTGIVWSTSNPFAEEDRELYFISDAPHLIKTIRNNLANSGSGSTRCLWNNGQHLWWSHIYQLYLKDTSGELRLTKLRDEHVRLTPSSKMSVRLAAQVLSESVGLVLRKYCGSEVRELSNFILLCDKFFDCLNTRSFSEHLAKRKPYLAPYKSTDDDRFQFLEDFLSYLGSWKQCVKVREGFNSDEKDKMFLTRQTYEGIVTTVRGFTGAARYLLSHGVGYIFSNVFCQDPLEEHFGRHRSAGRRSRNPSIYEFGYQENKLYMQRNLAFQFCPKGNTSGRAREREPIPTDSAPLPRIKRAKTCN